MSRILFIAGLIFIGFASGTVYIARPRVPEALLCERRVIDLGELRQNQTALGTFVLLNGTRRTVKILGITESCSCGIASVSAYNIEPGRKSEITVKWNTGSRRGKSGVELWADCAFADGTGVAVHLYLKGDIVPEYDVEPSAPKFKIGKCEKHLVVFSPNRMKGILVNHVLCSHKCLSARILEDNRSVEIVVDAAKWKMGADFTPWVTVTTNSALMPTIELPCTIQ